MDKNQQYISKSKKTELEVELHELESVKRKEVLEALEFAKGLGDLSENAEYHQAREDQGRLEDRVAQIKEVLQNAVVVEKHHSDKVEVGATVVVQKKGSKDKKTFDIVGAEEADMTQNKISHKSPLGGALLGKKEGEVAIFESPSGKVEYTVISIA
jgi:transcription elongation factor GreA